MKPVTRFGTHPSSVASDLLDPIERFLQEAIGQLEPVSLDASVKTRGRPRILPSLLLWSGLLVCVLRGFRSQLALWRLLTCTGLWHYDRFPVSDQAIYRRLEKDGFEPLLRLFELVRDALAQRLAPFRNDTLAPFAKEVVVLDATTLDKVARRLPALRPNAPEDYARLPGKLAALFDVRTQQWRKVLHVPNPCENDKVAARQMIEGLPPGSLVLLDLGYFGFEWFDHLIEQGFHFLSRLRHKTTYTVIHTFYRQGDTFDGLVYLGAHRADRMAHPVRLVSFRLGQALYCYVTSVTNPVRFPIADIARVYARRWDIEMAFNTIKTHLGLHLLWSAKTVVILQQTYAVLLIAQVLHALRLEIAHRAEVDPLDVSLPLMIQYLPQFAYEGKDPLAEFVSIGRQARFIRPSRRNTVVAPVLPPEDITPPPKGPITCRKPRYAHRKCGPR